MATRFVVQQRPDSMSREPEFLVADSEDGHRPVAEFDDRGAAQSHADELNAGPLDWDDQDAWKDPDDWDRPAKGPGPGGAG